LADALELPLSANPHGPDAHPPSWRFSIWHHFTDVKGDYDPTFVVRVRSEIFDEIRKFEREHVERDGAATGGSGHVRGSAERPQVHSFDDDSASQSPGREFEVIVREGLSEEDPVTVCRSTSASIVILSDPSVGWGAVFHSSPLGVSSVDVIETAVSAIAGRRAHFFNLVSEPMPVFAAGIRSLLDGGGPWPDDADSIRLGERIRNIDGLLSRSRQWLRRFAILFGAVALSGGWYWWEGLSDPPKSPAIVLAESPEPDRAEDLDEAASGGEEARQDSEDESESDTPSWIPTPSAAGLAALDLFPVGADGQRIGREGLPEALHRGLFPPARGVAIDDAAAAPDSASRGRQLAGRLAAFEGVAMELDAWAEGGIALASGNNRLSTGDAMRCGIVQRLIEVPADGQCGERTHLRLAAYAKLHRITQDGDFEALRERVLADWLRADQAAGGAR
jgi:hypothetical protein